MQSGDLLMFVDWRGDPDERLTPAQGSEVGAVLGRAASRGVDVRGLVWRSHLDKLSFSSEENRHLDEEVNAAGGQCVLDMRVRAGGSHHQKFVVLRHPSRPERDVAFVGGIDLCHSRRDDAEHLGAPQPQPMARQYGDSPPWHDIQLMIRGPAVGDVETVFRERWEDPQPLSRSPLRRASDALRHDQARITPLPEQLPDPAPCGPHPLQLLRTYPHRIGGYPVAPARGRRGAPRPPKGGGRRRASDALRHDQARITPLPEQLPDPAPCGPHPLQLLRTYPHRIGGYAFAPDGERSVARGYLKAVGRARTLVYVEDQYLWSEGVADLFTDVLTRNPGLHLVAVLPHFPDQNTRTSGPPNVIGREDVVARIRAAAPGRVAFYGIENVRGVPIYVHAKVCVLDDTWATVGSDNFNRRSWTHDSELSAAVVHEEYARRLRVSLAQEHLEDGDSAALDDPLAMFAAFEDSATRLQAWYDGGRRGPRPRGRLRPLHEPPLSRVQRRWAQPMYRTVYDPDGRRRSMRRTGSF